MSIQLLWTIHPDLKLSSSNFFGLVTILPSYVPDSLGSKTLFQIQHTALYYVSWEWHPNPLSMHLSHETSHGHCTMCRVCWWKLAYHSVMPLKDFAIVKLQTSLIHPPTKPRLTCCECHSQMAPAGDSLLLRSKSIAPFLLKTSSLPRTSLHSVAQVPTKTVAVLSICDPPSLLPWDSHFLPCSRVLPG